MQSTQKHALSRALLVSVHSPKVKETDTHESLAELSRLVTTLGFKVVGSCSQRQATTGAAFVVGMGKMKELANLTGNHGDLESLQGAADDYTVQSTRDDGPMELADVVVFDCDLSPSQLRNVGNALGVEVLDRTGVIIEIFSRHARTRTARLQVEIARLKYLVPRLRETQGGKNERQLGRGAGETALELDRRNVRDRLAELRRELKDVQREMQGRRSRRSTEYCVALVGYTNAGKSSTMRALTSSEVLVEDKLFATLDTTVRALQPETQPRILISDTVGFIKKLPHDLVASFRSTLDEAHNAALLLYVVDASDVNFRSQLEVVNQVLGDVGVQDIPSLLLLNKSDCLSEEDKLNLAAEFPEAVMISTRNPQDITALHQRIVAFCEMDMLEEDIVVPYTAKGVIGEVRASMRVLKEVYEADYIHLFVRAKCSDLERVKKLLASAQS
ncbi:MAG: GTP-binding protein HflX [Lentisphaeria bacterium]|jgi:GTP-binding protein HflX